MATNGSDEKEEKTEKIEAEWRLLLALLGRFPDYQMMLATAMNRQTEILKVHCTDCQHRSELGTAKLDSICSALAVLTARAKDIDEAVEKSRLEAVTREAVEKARAEASEKLEKSRLEAAEKLEKARADAAEKVLNTAAVKLPAPIVKPEPEETTTTNGTEGSSIRIRGGWMKIQVKVSDIVPVAKKVAVVLYKHAWWWFPTTAGGTAALAKFTAFGGWLARLFH